MQSNQGFKTVFAPQDFGAGEIHHGDSLPGILAVAPGRDRCHLFPRSYGLADQKPEYRGAMITAAGFMNAAMLCEAAVESRAGIELQGMGADPDDPGAVAG